MYHLQSTVRKIVETTGSLIERLLPKSIHTVIANGFELKVALFVFWFVCYVSVMFFTNQRRLV